MDDIIIVEVPADLNIISDYEYLQLMEDTYSWLYKHGFTKVDCLTRDGSKIYNRVISAKTANYYFVKSDKDIAALFAIRWC